MHMDDKRDLDTKLVDRMQAGDFEIFTELAQRYKGHIEWKANDLTNLPQECEDLVQEGYLGLFLAAKSYHPDKGASFKTYPEICIQNKMISAIRRSKSRKNMPLNTAVELDEEIEHGTEINKNPQILVELKGDFQLFVKRIQETLTPLEYKVLLVHLSNIKRTEVYSLIGIPLKTYDNALVRVRKKLRMLSSDLSL